MTMTAIMASILGKLTMETTPNRITRETIVPVENACKAEKAVITKEAVATYNNTYFFKPSNIGLLICAKDTTPIGQETVVLGIWRANNIMFPCVLNTKDNTYTPIIGETYKSIRKYERNKKLVWC